MNFTKPNDNELNKLVHERIQEIKQFKTIAGNILRQNKEFKNSTKKVNWKNDTLENNIFRLTELITELNLLRRNKEKLRNYVLGQLGDSNHWNEVIRQVNPLTFYGEISNFTIPGSVIYDLNWLSLISVGEKIDIAIGRTNPEILDKYWDTQCRLVKHKISENTKKELKEPFRLIDEAISIAKKNFFVSSNLTLFVVSERMIRYIATNLYHFQNPGINFDEAQKFIEKKQSLERILEFEGWKNDLEYPMLRIAVEYGYVANPEVANIIKTLSTAKKANEKIADLIKKLSETISSIKDNEDASNSDRNKITDLISEMERHGNGLLSSTDEKSKISIRVKLHFLIRRFKDDRNSIVHGKFEELNHRWKNFVYLSAVGKIIDTIDEYDKIYRLR